MKTGDDTAEYPRQVASLTTTILRPTSADPANTPDIRVGSWRGAAMVGKFRMVSA